MPSHISPKELDHRKQRADGAVELLLAPCADELGDIDLPAGGPPMQDIVIKLQTSLAIETAARPSFPTYWPTTAISTSE